MTTAALIEPEAPRSAAYAAGYTAIPAGENANPHAAETVEHRDWLDGFEVARIKNLAFAFVREQVNEPPVWCQERIRAWEDVHSRDMDMFVTRDYWTDTGSVNVFRVVGTCHAQYQGRTWLDFLLAGNRMPHNLGKLNDNPDYYLGPYQRRPKMDFYTLDGLDFYVGSDGNHRSCIARFFLGGRGESQLHDVTVHHSNLDWAFHEIYRDLRAELRHQGMAITLETDRRLDSREDTAGWKIDHYTPFLVWSDPQHETDVTLDREAALDRLITLRAQTKHSRSRPTGSWLKRLLGRETNQGAA